MVWAVWALFTVPIVVAVAWSWWAYSRLPDGHVEKVDSWQRVMAEGDTRGLADRAALSMEPPAVRRRAPVVPGSGPDSLR